uniref:Cell division protein n=1 Tax=Chloromonas radiata TaxID=47907 RepID=A0A0S2ICJ2_9CHLO|nr:cell division protein [Chloromonas radiata]
MCEKTAVFRKPFFCYWLLPFIGIISLIPEPKLSCKRSGTDNQSGSYQVKLLEEVAAFKSNLEYSKTNAFQAASGPLFLILQEGDGLINKIEQTNSFLLKQGQFYDASQQQIKQILKNAGYQGKQSFITELCSIYSQILSKNLKRPSGFAALLRKGEALEALAVLNQNQYAKSVLTNLQTLPLNKYSFVTSNINVPPAVVNGPSTECLLKANLLKRNALDFYWYDFKPYIHYGKNLRKLLNIDFPKNLLQNMTEIEERVLDVSSPFGEAVQKNSKFPFHFLGDKQLKIYQRSGTSCTKIFSNKHQTFSSQVSPPGLRKGGAFLGHFFQKQQSCLVRQALVWKKLKKRDVFFDKGSCLTGVTKKIAPFLNTDNSSTLLSHLIPSPAEASPLAEYRQASKQRSCLLKASQLRLATLKKLLIKNSWKKKTTKQLKVFSFRRFLVDFYTSCLDKFFSKKLLSSLKKKKVFFLKLACPPTSVRKKCLRNRSFLKFFLISYNQHFLKQLRCLKVAEGSFFKSGRRALLAQNCRGRENGLGTPLTTLSPLDLPTFTYQKASILLENIIKKRILEKENFCFNQNSTSPNQVLTLLEEVSKDSANPHVFKNKKRTIQNFTSVSSVVKKLKKYNKKIMFLNFYSPFNRTIFNVPQAVFPSAYPVFFKNCLEKKVLRFPYTHMPILTKYIYRFPASVYSQISFTPGFRKSDLKLIQAKPLEKEKNYQKKLSIITKTVIKSSKAATSSKSLDFFLPVVEEEERAAWYEPLLKISFLRKNKIDLLNILKELTICRNIIASPQFLVYKKPKNGPLLKVLTLKNFPNSCLNYSNKFLKTTNQKRAQATYCLTKSLRQELELNYSYTKINYKEQHNCLENLLLEKKKLKTRFNSKNLKLKSGDFFQKLRLLPSSSGRKSCLVRAAWKVFISFSLKNHCQRLAYYLIKPIFLFLYTRLKNSKSSKAATSSKSLDFFLPVVEEEERAAWYEPLIKREKEKIKIKKQDYFVWLKKQYLFILNMKKKQLIPFLPVPLWKRSNPSFAKQGKEGLLRFQSGTDDQSGSYQASTFKSFALTLSGSKQRSGVKNNSVAFSSWFSFLWTNLANNSFFSIAKEMQHNSFFSKQLLSSKAAYYKNYFFKERSSLAAPLRLKAELLKVFLSCLEKGFNLKGFKIIKMQHPILISGFKNKKLIKKQIKQKATLRAQAASFQASLSVNTFGSSDALLLEEGKNIQAASPLCNTPCCVFVGAASKNATRSVAKNSVFRSVEFLMSSFFSSPFNFKPGEAKLYFKNKENKTLVTISETKPKRSFTASFAKLNTLSSVTKKTFSWDKLDTFGQLIPYCLRLKEEGGCLFTPLQFFNKTKFFYHPSPTGRINNREEEKNKKAFNIASIKKVKGVLFLSNRNTRLLNPLDLEAASTKTSPSKIIGRRFLAASEAAYNNKARSISCATSFSAPSAAKQRKQTIKTNLKLSPNTFYALHHHKKLRPNRVFPQSLSSGAAYRGGLDKLFKSYLSQNNFSHKSKTFFPSAYQVKLLYATRWHSCLKSFFLSPNKANKGLNTQKKHKLLNTPIRLSRKMITHYKLITAKACLTRKASWFKKKKPILFPTNYSFYTSKLRNCLKKCEFPLSPSGRIRKSGALKENNLLFQNRLYIPCSLKKAKKTSVNSACFSLPVGESEATPRVAKRSLEAVYKLFLKATKNKVYSLTDLTKTSLFAEKSLSLQNRLKSYPMLQNQNMLISQPLSLFLVELKKQESFPSYPCNYAASLSKLRLVWGDKKKQLIRDSFNKKESKSLKFSSVTPLYYATRWHNSSVTKRSSRKQATLFYKKTGAYLKLIKAKPLEGFYRKIIKGVALNSSNKNQLLPSNIDFIKDKKKNLQKKRRALKQRRDTGRLLKRKRFYPRPLWLRLTMYNKFLKYRHIKKLIPPYWKEEAILLCLQEVAQAKKEKVTQAKKEVVARLLKATLLNKLKTILFLKKMLKKNSSFKACLTRKASKGFAFWKPFLILPEGDGSKKLLKTSNKKLLLCSPFWKKAAYGRSLFLTRLPLKNGRGSVAFLEGFLIFYNKSLDFSQVNNSFPLLISLLKLKGGKLAKMNLKQKHIKASKLRLATLLNAAGLIKRIRAATSLKLHMAEGRNFRPVNFFPSAYQVLTLLEEVRCLKKMSSLKTKIKPSITSVADTKRKALKRNSLFINSRNNTTKWSSGIFNDYNYQTVNMSLYYVKHNYSNFQIKRINNSLISSNTPSYPIPSGYGGVNFFGNKTDAFGKRFKNVYPIFSDSSAYNVSKNVYTEFKQGLWKSSWLRSNLNSYLKKIKSVAETLKKTSTKWEFDFLTNVFYYHLLGLNHFNLSKSFITNPNSFFQKQLLPSARALSPTKIETNDIWYFDLKNNLNSNSKKNFFPFHFLGDKQQSWPFSTFGNLPSERPGFLNVSSYYQNDISGSYQASPLLLEEVAALNLLKWENALKIAVYNQITYQATLKQIVLNIKENIKKNGQTKAQTGKSTRTKIKKPIISGAALFNYANKLLQTPSTFLAVNMLTKHPFLTSKASFGGNMSNKRIYWALNKTNIWHYQNINKKKYLWANQKQREQNRSNKTKKLITKLFKRSLSWPILEKYDFKTLNSSITKPTLFASKSLLKENKSELHVYTNSHNLFLKKQKQKENKMNYMGFFQPPGRGDSWLLSFLFSSNLNYKTTDSALITSLNQKLGIRATQPLFCHFLKARVRQEGNKKTIINPQLLSVNTFGSSLFSPKNAASPRILKEGKVILRHLKNSLRICYKKRLKAKKLLRTYKNNIFDYSYTNFWNLLAKKHFRKRKNAASFLKVKSVLKHPSKHVVLRANNNHFWWNLYYPKQNFFNFIYRNPYNMELKKSFNPIMSFLTTAKYSIFIVCTIVFHLCSLFSLASISQIRCVLKFMILFSLKISFLYLGFTRLIYLYFFNNFFVPLKQKIKKNPTFYIRQTTHSGSYQAASFQASLSVNTFGSSDALLLEEVAAYKKNKKRPLFAYDFKKIYHASHLKKSKIVIKLSIPSASLYKNLLEAYIGNKSYLKLAQAATSLELLGQAFSRFFYKLLIKAKKKKRLLKATKQRSCFWKKCPRNQKKRLLLYHPSPYYNKGINNSKSFLLATLLNLSGRRALLEAASTKTYPSETWLLIEGFYKEKEAFRSFCIKIKSKLFQNPLFLLTRFGKLISYAFKQFFKNLFPYGRRFVDKKGLFSPTSSFGWMGTKLCLEKAEPLTQIQNRKKIFINYTKIIRLRLIKTFLQFGVTLQLRCFLLFSQFADIPKNAIKSIYIFLEKPGELLSDWITHLFLIEIASDLTTTIPENTDSSIWNSFTKFAKASSFRLIPILGTLTEKRLLSSFELFYEIVSQPDTDLMVRQKKGKILWDIWGEILKNVAEENNINISLLTNKKEDQSFLLSKLLDFSKQRSSKAAWLGQLHNPNLLRDISPAGDDFKTGWPSQPIGYAYKPNSVPELHFTPLFLKDKQLRYFEKLLFFSLEAKQEGENKEKKTIFKPIKKRKEPIVTGTRDHVWQRWSTNQFITYKGKDSDLFIQASPAPKSLKNFKSIKHYNPIHSPIGTIICQMYSGIFYKQTAKNFLVVGTSSYTTGVKNSNYPAGDEKSLLIQSLAGETEMKIIRDNANRYNFALGIKSLRNVFDALALHTPCIFLIEDIHVIGERRPLLVSDPAGEENSKAAEHSSGTEPHHAPHNDEKNLLIYQLTRHTIMHYKKPFRGDFSFLIPTNNYSFNLFLGVSSPRTRNSGLTPLSPIPLEKKDSDNKAEFVNNPNTNSTSNKLTNGTSFKASALQLPSRLRLAPPSTAPFKVLLFKEQNKFKPKKTEAELAWIGLPASGTGPNELPKITYSIRVKVALLAHLAVSNLAVKLNMITDLLVIIDSVRANRGFVVFATTHTPAILDPALRRPGRLDETIALPFIPKLESRWEIVKANLIDNSAWPSFYKNGYAKKPLFLSILTDAKLRFDSGFPRGLTVDLLDYGLFNYSLSTINLQTFKILKAKKRPAKLTKVSLSTSRLKENLVKFKKQNLYKHSDFKKSAISLDTSSKSVNTWLGQLLPYKKPNKTLALPSKKKAGFYKQQSWPFCTFSVRSSLRPGAQATYKSGSYEVAALSTGGRKNSLIPSATLNKNSPSNLLAIAYSKIGKVVINCKYAFNYTNLSLFSTLLLPLRDTKLENQTYLTSDSSETKNDISKEEFIYLHLYTKQEHLLQAPLEQYLMNLFAAKVTETLAFSGKKFIYTTKRQGGDKEVDGDGPYFFSNLKAKKLFPKAATSLELLKAKKRPAKLTKVSLSTSRLRSFQKKRIRDSNAFTSSSPFSTFGDKNYAASPLIQAAKPLLEVFVAERSRKLKQQQIPFFGIWSLQGIDKTWRAASSLIFSLIEKRFIYQKNLVIPKLLQFYNAVAQRASLQDPPSAPSSFLLLPAKRYENYKRSFLAMQNKEKSSPSASIHLQSFHHKRVLKQKLYSLPAIPNIKTTSLPGESKNNSIFPKGEQTFSKKLEQIEKPTPFRKSINWYYRNKLLNRHRGYLNNQWWNGQLYEHNVETTFLSDVDWRSNFVSSFNSKNFAAPLLSQAELLEKNSSFSPFQDSKKNSAAVFRKLLSQAELFGTFFKELETNNKTILFKNYQQAEPFGYKNQTSFTPGFRKSPSPLSPSGRIRKGIRKGEALEALEVFVGEQDEKGKFDINKFNQNKKNKVLKEKQIPSPCLTPQGGVGVARILRPALATIGDILIDFPDFDQHYNPRNRRWILNFGYWSYWYNFQTTHNNEIYSYIVTESFLKTYNFLNSNREILDYFVTKFIKFGLYKEITIVDGIKRF